MTPVMIAPAAGCVGAEPIRYDAAAVVGPADAGMIESPLPVPPVALPFAVSNEFMPNGRMGDAEQDPNAVIMMTDACKQPRPAGALGECYRFQYHPRPFVAGASHTWAGIQWLGPSKSWGETPGKKVSPGATRVSFWAAGATGQETVTFGAGGVIPSAPDQIYKDSFDVDAIVTLTTEWTRYTLDMAPYQYEEVLGAFSWVIETTQSAQIVFFLDGIVWEK
jgi:hypothetical protein